MHTVPAEEGEQLQETNWTWMIDTRSGTIHLAHATAHDKAPDGVLCCQFITRRGPKIILGNDSIPFTVLFLQNLQIIVEFCYFTGKFWVIL